MEEYLDLDRIEIRLSLIRSGLLDFGSRFTSPEKSWTQFSSVFLDQATLGLLRGMFSFSSVWFQKSTFFIGFFEENSVFVDFSLDEKFTPCKVLSVV